MSLGRTPAPPSWPPPPPSSPRRPAPAPAVTTSPSPSARSPRCSSSPSRAPGGARGRGATTPAHPQQGRPRRPRGSSAGPGREAGSDRPPETQSARDFRGEVQTPRHFMDDAERAVMPAAGFVALFALTRLAGTTHNDAAAVPACPCGSVAPPRACLSARFDFGDLTSLGFLADALPAPRHWPRGLSCPVRRTGGRRSGRARGRLGLPSAGPALRVPPRAAWASSGS